MGEKHRYLRLYLFLLQTLVIAAASIDDVLAISGFTILLGIAIKAVNKSNCETGGESCETSLTELVFQVIYRGVTPFGPLLWQAEADTEMTLSASLTTAVGQKALALAKRRYSTVIFLKIYYLTRNSVTY